MTDSWHLGTAAAILALGLVALGVFGSVVKALIGRQEWNTRGSLSFLLRYMAIFGILLGLEVLISWLLPSLHESLRDSVATVVGGAFHMLGTDASVAGSLISVGNPLTVFDITAACLGGLLFWVYLALVMAEPRANRRQRLKGLLFGIGILLVFNIFRIATSVYLEGTRGLRVHDWFYLVNVLVVLLVWAGWVRSFTTGAKAASA